MAQTDQYTQILLSKKIGKEVHFYSKGYGIISDSKTGRSGIVDSLGNITFNDSFKSEISRLSENRFILKGKEGNFRGKVALIDEKGTELIPMDNFRYRTWENKERLIYSKAGIESVYDYNGKQVIPSSDKIEFASENRIFVKKGGAWFIYDYDGKQVSDRAFDEDLRFYKGRVYITTGIGKGEIIDSNGKTLSQISNHYIEDINGFPFLVTKNIAKSRYGIVDESETVLADEIYEQAFVGRKYIYLIKDNKVNIFSKAEKKVYPTEFHYVNHLFDGLFKSLKDDKNPKIAVLKTDGEVIFPKEFDVVEAFKIEGEDYLYVSKENEEQLLDKNLKNILDEGYQIEKVFFDNLIVKKDDIFYKFSPKNRSYTALKNIASIKPFQFYPAIICKNKENFYGMLDEEGNEVIPFMYDDIVTFLGENEIVVQKGKKFGLTNHKGEPLKEVIYDKYSTDRKGIKLTRVNDSEYLYFTPQKEKIFFE
ncbi:WG repeat-containing protein [Chryseobacterium populi]|uniref:KWG repeat protein n=1 Tax=Chryseobacterium populi TaxID=1144316 RepID=J2KQ21_9FLAO|nr:WG repeat-containing protein [Chryseobacterium populi]EJL75153.1 hypothetical protein PMI13_00630 [Chryseobacterium populi]